MQTWLRPLGALVLAAGIFAALVSRAPAPSSAKLQPYLYEDTKELVLTVEDAADLVAKQGPGAFTAFREPGSRWFNDRLYLFIYDVDGVCVFHPVTPELVGKNRLNLKDINGKAMIAQITEVGRKPGPDPSGWVFYCWAERNQLTPVWKCAYIRKAVGPDGKIYCVGSGLTNMKLEKALIRERVDAAADLLRTRGTEVALAQFRDPASTFNFMDSYLFVIDGQGRTVIDPSFPNLEQRDLRGFQDSIGTYVIRELIAKLQNQDETWLQYMRPKPGETLPSRKLVYMRKVQVDGQTLLVGADYFLATPIWMKL